MIGYGLSGRLVPGMIDCLGAVVRRRRPPRAADHLLERRGAARRDGPGAVRAPSGRPLAPRCHARRRRGGLRAAGHGRLPLLLARGDRGSRARPVVLLAAVPTWPQLRAAVTGLSLARSRRPPASSALPGVASAVGSAGEQQRDGAAMLALLVVIMAGGGLVAPAPARRSERHGVLQQGCATLAASRPWPRRPWPVRGRAGGRRPGRETPIASSGRRGASRLASVNSVRYEYWRVGLDGFAGEPVRGLGAGGFRVLWRRERSVEAGVRGAFAAARDGRASWGSRAPAPRAVRRRRRRRRRAGRSARVLRWRRGRAPRRAAWLLHATIDWDWQLPAVTLPAIVLAGGAAG